MILTTQDIYRLLNLGIPWNSFVEYRDGHYRLKNVDKHCVFLDPTSGKCLIYNFRPLGCRIYPIIYDRDKGFLIDERCPAKDTISVREYNSKIQVLAKLLRDIGEL